MMKRLFGILTLIIAVTCKEGSAQGSESGIASVGSNGGPDKQQDTPVTEEKESDSGKDKGTLENILKRERRNLDAIYKLQSEQQIEDIREAGVTSRIERNIYERSKSVLKEKPNSALGWAELACVASFIEILYVVTEFFVLFEVVSLFKYLAHGQKVIGLSPAMASLSLFLLSLPLLAKVIGLYNVFWLFSFFSVILFLSPISYVYVSSAAYYSPLFVVHFTFGLFVLWIGTTALFTVSKIVQKRYRPNGRIAMKFKGVDEAVSVSLLKTTCMLLMAFATISFLLIGEIPEIQVGFYNALIHSSIGIFAIYMVPSMLELGNYGAISSRERNSALSALCTVLAAVGALLILLNTDIKRLYISKDASLCVLVAAVLVSGLCKGVAVYINRGLEVEKSYRTYVYTTLVVVSVSLLLAAIYLVYVRGLSLGIAESTIKHVKEEIKEAKEKVVEKGAEKAESMYEYVKGVM